MPDSSTDNELSDLMWEIACYLFWMVGSALFIISGIRAGDAFSTIGAVLFALGIGAILFPLTRKLAALRNSS